MRLRTSICGQAERGGKRDILRPQPLPCRQREAAERNIFAGGTDIGAGFQTGGENNSAGVIEAHILLHEHRVGPSGIGAPVKIRTAWPGSDWLVRRRTGLNPPGHRKYRFPPGGRSLLRTA